MTWVTFGQVLPFGESTMGIDTKQLLELVVRPVLDEIGAGGVAAEQLVMGTIAQESDMGTWLHQRGAGPALATRFHPTWQPCSH
jgi:hypothetical protein